MCALPQSRKLHGTCSTVVVGSIILGMDIILFVILIVVDRPTLIYFSLNLEFHCIYLKAII